MMMRKNVTLLFLCLFSMVHAQETYESVLEEGLTWNMECCGIAQTEWVFSCSYRDLVLLDDTLIDDIPFKRVYGRSLSGSSGYVKEPDSYLIGQKDGIVYQYEENEKDWEKKYYPIMDFTLSVGDEFTVYEEDPYDDEKQLWELWIYKVTAVSDTILDSSTDKHPRHCVYVQDVRYENQKDCWIEGIGSMKYGITGRRGFHLFGERLIKCFRDEEVFYSTDVWTGIDNADVRRNTCNKNTLYDLQGRRLTTQPRRGIYVKDGKKVVVK